MTPTKTGIHAVGHYLPTRCIDNHHFLTRGLDTSPEWIETRTGILNRHIAADDECTSDLAYHAALQALGTRDANTIDFIIVATASPDYLGFPSTACLVQKKLGITRPIPCFDITAACSGFAYGLGIANGYIASGMANQGLVIGAEILSRLVDWSDRRTAILFGDGAGAALVGRVPQGGIIGIDQGANGHEADILYCQPTPHAQPFNPDNHPISPASVIHMNGPQVFRTGVQMVVASIQRVAHDADCDLNTIDYFVCHQANIRILDRVAKTLNVPLDKFLTNIDSVGNTSAASIPVVLSQYASQFNPGDRLCLVGFGSGFTWASIILEWSDI